MRYAVELTPDDNGTLLATVPDLPEVATFGENEEVALGHAIDAIATAIQGRMSDRETVPEPGPVGQHSVTLPALSVMKVALYRAMLAAGLRKSDLGRRLGWKPAQVDRLFNLRHASRVDQIEEAFRVLGKSLEIEVRDAA
ncbi:type II toxin-antitoxin system HicB family antitoxin [Paradevosia shaoguanensis]|uniref:type II toxin-antitoxin system HicB family antitoxin n=1 Tax=Paradevosia shaoguanensis TaxID=1335043 RepID=UPI0019341D20|nr:type II toxin-antitoxin system HicB family antitoxin [Paradevosia shaoguanensis]